MGGSLWSKRQIECIFVITLPETQWTGKNDPQNRELLKLKRIFVLVQVQLLGTIKNKIDSLGNHKGMWDN